MADWLVKNTARLAAARPEGYDSWGALLDHLQSQEELSDDVQLALIALATLSEPEITAPSADVIKAQQKASIDFCLKKSAPAEMEGVCAKLEKMGDDLDQYTDQITSWVEKLSSDTRSALVTVLCQKKHSRIAKVITENSISAAHCQFILVAAHHNLQRIVEKFLNTDINCVIKFLCTLDAAEARIVLDKCPLRSELIHVAVHHGLTDMYPKFIDSERYIHARGVIKHLCGMKADDARPVVEACLDCTPLIRRSRRLWPRVGRAPRVACARRSPLTW
jgi:hypothetical protein